MKRISAIDMASKIRTNYFDLTLDEVKKQVDWKKESFLVLLDDNKNVFGVLSQSDMLQAERYYSNLKSVHAWEVCSHKLLSVDENADINDVMRLMLDKHIHHVLVHNDDKYNGIISTLDILRIIHDKHIIH